MGSSMYNSGKARQLAKVAQASRLFEREKQENPLGVNEHQFKYMRGRAYRF